MQPAIRPECGDVGIPVQRDVRGDEDEIKHACQFRERGGVPRPDDVVGTEFPRFIRLRFAGSERRDFTSPLV